MNAALLTTSPLKLLGGLDSAEFLREYWQKKPLLIRQAVPGFSGLLTDEALFELACDADVESRHIAQDKNSWQVTHGPLDASLLNQQNAAAPWTVLVQSLNHWLDEANDLLRHFDFIPLARLDDLMVSYATDGGGVGPHYDHYDVFLLQGTGQRRWLISNDYDPTPVPDMELRLVAPFTAQHDWTLNPGDMLYLPPAWAHDGIAVGTCTTYSIGFRTPSFQELGEQFLYWLQERLDLPGHYADPDLQATTNPARIDGNMIATIAQQLHKIHWQESDIADFMGHYLTEPKASVFFDAAQRPLSQTAFAEQLKQSGLTLDRRSILLTTTAGCYLNGERLAVASSDQAARTLLETLARERRLAPAPNCSAELATLLHQAWQDGFVHLPPSA